MFLYSKSVTPAVQSHVEAQTAFINDLSRSFLESFQNLAKLNVQLAQTMLEESTNAAQHIFSSNHPSGVFNATASSARPVAEKLRAYQQQLSRLAADSQVEVARITEEHVPKTSSTAKKLAEDVARSATEETQRGMEKQKEAMRNFTDPFTKHGQDKSAARAGASLQSTGEGNVQGGNPENSASGKSK